MIVFFVFLFAFVPSKTVMISLGDDRLVMLEKTETFCSRKEFSFFSVRAFELIHFAADCCENSSVCRNFSELYRLLQTGLLLTDSVFVVLVAYFDETMDSIGGC